MKVSALVPYRPDGGHRDRGWEWSRKRWEALLPDVEVVVRSDDGGSTPGQFAQPLAINRCARAATGDVFIMVETVFDDPQWVHDAAELIRAGDTAWVLHAEYHRLTESESEVILNRDPAGPIPPTNPEWVGESWAGMVVMSAEAFWDLGGYDERFTWWGAHDVCWANAMTTLHTPPVRLPGRTLHFWHPSPLADTYGNPEHRRQHALMERYLAAAGDRVAMRELVSEWRA